MRHSFIAIVGLLIAASMCTAQTNHYSSWANFPQSQSFFPIAVFSQDPTWSMGTGAPYSSVAAGILGTKMNMVLQVENGYPTTFGVDPGGRYQTLITNGIYFIPGNSGIQANNTNPNSVASYQAIAAAESGSQYLIGYQLGDEPDCPTTGTLPTTVARIQGYDTTRPMFWNFSDWPFGHGACFPPSSPTNSVALQAISVGSRDEYPVTSPWNGNSSIPQTVNVPEDSMWIAGWSIEQLRVLGRANQPIWGFPDSGTTELGYSLQNGSTCTPAANVCKASDNTYHEYRATSEQVNAETWMSLINGATGIEWFCDDTNVTSNSAYNFCLGATVEGVAADNAVAAAVASNLTYIDTTVLSYAPQLNGNLTAICTMNTGTLYSNYGTSCSNGILAMSTGTSTVPGSAMVRSYNGTLYLFADSDRNGPATMTFTLSGYAGATAKVVYDSNAQYDPAHSSVGSTFTLNTSGQFSDTFGANGHNYQPKIYTISSAGPTAPTSLKATVN
jgi:hypothetical protein